MSFQEWSLMVHWDDSLSGDMVRLPPSVLHHITEREPHVSFPLIFQLHHWGTAWITHAGVQDFNAVEGTIGISQSRWRADVADVRLSSVRRLLKGTQVCFRVETSEAMLADRELDYGALLEYALREYMTLTVSDVIVVGAIRFVVETLQPAWAVSIKDTDLHVDLVFPTCVGSAATEEHHYRQEQDEVPANAPSTGHTLKHTDGPARLIERGQDGYTYVYDVQPDGTRTVLRRFRPSNALVH
jgi:Ubiquitin fusion degradation protein UFD1